MRRPPSSPARLQNLGLLQEKKQQAIDCSLRIDELRKAITSETNRHRKIEELDIARLRVLTDDLADATQRHIALCREIRALCQELGEPYPNVDLGVG